MSKKAIIALVAIAVFITAFFVLNNSILSWN